MEEQLLNFEILTEKYREYMTLMCTLENVRYPITVESFAYYLKTGNLRKNLIY